MLKSPCLNETLQGFSSGGPSRRRIGTRRYIAFVSSASRRVRKSEHVRVFGLRSAISAAERRKRRSGSASSPIARRSKASSALSWRTLNPPSVRRQNDVRLSVSGKKRRISQKLYRLAREPSSARLAKKYFVVSSLAMPDGM